jgi:hypothetical protein
VARPAELDFSWSVSPRELLAAELLRADGPATPAPEPEPAGLGSGCGWQSSCGAEGPAAAAWSDGAAAARRMLAELRGPSRVD